MYHLNDLHADGQERWHTLLEEAENHRRLNEISNKRNFKLVSRLTDWIRTHASPTRTQRQLARE